MYIRISFHPCAYCSVFCTKCPAHINRLEWHIISNIYIFRVDNSVTCYLLPITCYLLSVTYYLLLVICYLLPITYYLLPVTDYLLPVTCYLSCLQTDVLYSTQHSSLFCVSIFVRWCNHSIIIIKLISYRYQLLYSWLDPVSSETIYVVLYENKPWTVGTLEDFEWIVYIIELPLITCKINEIPRYLVSMENTWCVWL